MLYFQLNLIPFVNKLNPFDALNVMTGMMTGESKMDMTLPDVTESTINSGGYGSCKLLKIPATSTMTVSGPNPIKPKIMTINGNRVSGLINGTNPSTRLNPFTTALAKPVCSSAKINTPTESMTFS